MSNIRHKQMKTTELVFIRIDGKTNNVKIHHKKTNKERL